MFVFLGSVLISLVSTVSFLRLLAVPNHIYFTDRQLTEPHVSRAVTTPEGTRFYERVITDVWATSYDSTCPGCDNVTATGLPQGFGVVAVDPKVIPLRSEVYIPGYGVAIAGDVGGAIKGKRVDVGFDTLEGQWKAHFVDVYVLE